MLVQFDIDEWESAMQESINRQSFEYRMALTFMMMFITKRVVVDESTRTVSLALDRVGEFDTIVTVKSMDLKVYIALTATSTNCISVRVVNKFEAVRLKEIRCIQQCWRGALSRKRVMGLRISTRHVVFE
jgi:hypothetical protein